MTAVRVLTRSCVAAVLLAVTVCAVAVSAGPTFPAEAVAPDIVDAFESLTFSDNVVDPAAVVNGCGSQGPDGVDVPDEWFGVSFTPGCDWHDRCYGTSGMSQGYCDAGMLVKNVAACAGMNPCTLVAVAYAATVAVVGHESYMGGQREANERSVRRSAWSMGDPHLSTFDGRRYQFMAAGEFRLSSDAAGDVIQARFHPFNEFMSMTVGVAVRIGSQRVVVQTDPATFEFAMFVDGSPVAGPIVELGDGTIVRDQHVIDARSTISIRSNDGLQVDIVDHARYFDVSAFLPQARFGAVDGLLGDGDGVYDNDPLIDDATPISATVLDTFPPDPRFVSRYRLAPEQSWFIPGYYDYHGAELLDLPRNPLALDQFPPDDVAGATQVCADAGLTGRELDACIIDVALTGDIRFATRHSVAGRRVALFGGGESARPNTPVTDDTVPPMSPTSDDPTADLADLDELCDAIGAADSGTIEAMVAEGRGIRVPPDHLGPSPLYCALLYEDAATTALLLDAGADPNTAMGASHMMIFAVGAGPEFVRLMVDAGGDPNGGVPAGSTDPTPLGWAALFGDIEVVRTLLELGATTDRDVFVSGTDLRSMITDPELRALLGII